MFFFIGLKPELGKYLYYDSHTNEIDNMKGVSMNTKYIFFWNPGKVWKLDLKEKKLVKLQIYVSERELRTEVKNVRTGSVPDTVIIKIKQSESEDCMVLWDLENNFEIESFDVANNSFYFQDKSGNPYIVEGDSVRNCREGSMTKSYRFKVSDFNFENCTFRINYGVRLENKTRNWVILRNFINLSFSYMTFVIKENFEAMGYVLDDFVFDIEGYDYILNGNNLFTEGDLVKNQYEKMQYILNSYKEVDPALLESLHFVNSDGKLPLHIAIEANNNRMVNLIIESMAKIDFTAFRQV